MGSIVRASASAFARAASITSATAQAARADAIKFRVREIHGVVIKSGFMDKTVTVTCANKEWNSLLKKYFDRPVQHLVHDPNNSLRTGDVVAIVAGWRVSKTVRHVVKHIVKPAGVPIEERPPIPTEEERVASRDAAKAAKDRRRAFSRATEMLERKVQNMLQSNEEMMKRGRRAVVEAAKALPEKRPVVMTVLETEETPRVVQENKSPDPYGWGLHQKLPHGKAGEEGAEK